MIELEEQLKELEKERIRLEEKKKALQEQIEQSAAAEKQLQDLFEKSGFPTPRALVVALMKKYGVKLTSAPSEGGRRKRTKVTAQLRDEIRDAVNGGLSKNQATKKFDLSYLVVNKVMAGEYDKL
jgi:type II secretory pathway component PulF